MTAHYVEGAGRTGLARRKSSPRDNPPGILRITGLGIFDILIFFLSQFSF